MSSAARNFAIVLGIFRDTGQHPMLALPGQLYMLLLLEKTAVLCVYWPDFVQCELPSVRGPSALEA